MANLYELTGEWIQLMDKLEAGEDVELEFNETDEAFEEKAEKYAMMIRNLESDYEAFDKEEKHYKEKKNRCKKGIEKLKNNLESAMIITGKRKFKKGVFSFSIQKNGGKLPVIVDVPTEELEDEFVIVTEKPDLTAIEKYINETGDITFAHFGERKEGLRIK